MLRQLQQVHLTLTSIYLETFTVWAGNSNYLVTRIVTSVLLSNMHYIYSWSWSCSGRNEVILQRRWKHCVFGHAPSFVVGSDPGEYWTDDSRQVLFGLVTKVTREWPPGHDSGGWWQFRLRPRLFGIARIKPGGLRQHLPKHKSPFPFCELFSPNTNPALYALSVILTLFHLRVFRSIFA